MLFNSLEFLYFLPVVLALYYLLTHRFQNLFLLIASYFFYGSWDWRFLSLLAISTLVDFFCGMAIEDTATNATRRRKHIVLVSILVNLLILGFFKYFGFFYDSLNELLTKLGVTVPSLALKIALPVGISFYTFQSLSYTIDVYYGRVKASRDILTFALYVSFFPQLVAGPIERAGNLLHQVENPRRTTGYQVASGLWLILLGYFKKVAISDAISPFVDQAFNNPQGVSAPMALGGIYLFALQIYGDFSGYTDIARGCARLMGFELMVNFRQPYLSKSIGEFWRRWHISLSTWFRDYVYIPLGGNRRGTGRTYFNLALTMMVTGFWHGANWTFIVWGAIHGVFLLGERALGLRPSRVHETKLFHGSVGRRLGDFLRIVLVFNIAAFAFAIFRAHTVTDGFRVIGRVFSGFDGADWTNLGRFAFFGGLMLLYDLSQELLQSDEPGGLFLPAWAGAIVAALLLIAILVFGSQAQSFIYFQF